MRKVVVYGGTRNLYKTMRTAVASLLANNAIDKVYLLIEDNEFPYDLPGCVETINVSNQQYFPENSANYNTRWAYMALMRCALSLLLPNERRVLWLDCDTIVDADITELFEIDLYGCYYGAVKEVVKSREGVPYFNSGVLLCDLDEIRKSKQDERLLMYINTTPLELPDQNAINDLCKGRIYALESEYNCCSFTKACTEKVKIYHYAGRPVFDNDPVYRKYDKSERAQRVLIAVPCMDWVYTDFMDAFMKLEKPENTVYTIVKNTLIYNGRNMIAKNAIKHGFDRVMWLDSDVIVKPDTLMRLMADMDKGLDFVTGVYFMRKLPTKPVLYSEVWWQVNEGFADAGQKHVEQIPGGLFEVAGAGFGCCMTSIKLLKDLVDKVGAPFTPLIGVSEDLSFCLRAKQAGYKLWCDGDIKCGHIGTIEHNETMFAPNCT